VILYQFFIKILSRSDILITSLLAGAGIGIVTPNTMGSIPVTGLIIRLD